MQDTTCLNRIDRFLARLREIGIISLMIAGAYTIIKLVWGI